ncbi:hypothetical protein LSCM4_06634 [Leishmania orientalis]|uniref:Uncharacterized protein n=1 Tax=Leishmania orientalis TaxID=2249476 RepID=A0A836KSV5_9TRYP|nr:hypothetical protein LSCM4_06634 [Leishmania orientalis]
MASAPHMPPPPPAGLNHSEHVEAAPPMRLQVSHATSEIASDAKSLLDPRPSHVMNASSRSSSDRAERMWHPAEVSASRVAELYQPEHKRFMGAPALALQPPPPLWMQHSTDAPASAAPLSSSSTSSSLLGEGVGDGGENHSSISSRRSSDSASHTSSHYLIAIQRDLEAIVLLQQQQLQERRVPLPSEASTTESVPKAWIGAEQTPAVASAISTHHHFTASVDKADSAMHLESIERAKQTWLEGEVTTHASLRQQQPQQALSHSRHAHLAVGSAGAHNANASGAAPHLSLGPWQPSSQGTSDTLLSLPPHEVSGLSISAGTGVSVTHHQPQQQQQQPQPPPPPPSSSPIPASLVEYQRYLMQLEHQQRQHREVLRRHRKQRKEMMVAAQRKTTLISVPLSTTTPPRQRTGVGVAMGDRRDRSPPLAMMMQAMRQRRGDGRGISGVDTWYGDTSSSATSTAASSAKRQRSLHSQKRRHPVTPSPTAAAAPSRDRSGGRRASRSRSLSAEGAGLLAAAPAGVPAVALIDASTRSSYRRSTPQLGQRRGADARNSATNSSSRRPNSHQRSTAAAKRGDGQRLAPKASPLIVDSPSRPVPPAPGPTDAALLPAYTDAAIPTGPQSSPVEAFADALLMDASGTVRTGGGGVSSVGPLPAPAPPPLMAMHGAAGTAVTAVGGRAAKPPPIIFSIASSGAVVTHPGHVGDALRSEAEVAPAADQTARYHRSRDHQRTMRSKSSPTTMTTTTPASSPGSSPSRERGMLAVRTEGGARSRTGNGSADPGVTSPAYSRHRQRSHIAEPIFLQSDNGFHWRVARRRSRGVAATIAAADVPHSQPDGQRRHRYHLHRHHRSMEGISSTIPEHGTGTPRSSRYRYNSSSTARQPKQLRRSPRHPRRNAGGADARGDRHGRGIKHPVDTSGQRVVSPGDGSEAHRHVTDRGGSQDATATAGAASNDSPAGRGAVSRRAHPRPLPPSRSAAAVWQDVKLMWAPAPAAHAPFAAAYRYHPHSYPPTSRGQPQRSSSAFAGTNASNARVHSADGASAAAMRETGASRAPARGGGAAPSAPSPLSAAISHTTERKASASAPLLCMTDSLIGAALRDVLPVCRARQREVAREVTRRRYQLPPTGVVGVAYSAIVL